MCAYYFAQRNTIENVAPHANINLSEAEGEDKF